MATDTTSEGSVSNLDETSAAVFDAALTSGSAASMPRPDSELEAAMSAVDFAEMSDEQLDSLGSGDHERIAKALNLDVAPTRISLRAVTDPEERRAVADATRLVRDGKHSTLRGALIEVLGLQASAEPEAANAGDAPDPQGAPIEERISLLEQDLKQARDFFDYDRALEIQERILDLRQTQHAEARQQSQLQEWSEAEDVCRASVITLFPQLSDPESEFSQLVEDEIVIAENRQPDLFLSPDWPEKIAIRVNEKHGKKFGGGAAEPGGGRASRTIPNPPPRPGVRMPGSPVGPGANTSTLTAHTALAAFDQLSLEEQDAVLTQLDIVHQRRGRGRP
ncbi:MAG TPA: hypothetical protein VD994_01780 [Prosthecobacter sp.]|nr:hypothetical protein [Prosthecobacter sp.]